MLNSALFQSATDEWATPQPFFDLLTRFFDFDLDVCASAENHKCERYFTREINGLEQSWITKKWWFCNPPYGRDISKWIKKAQSEVEKGYDGILLIPARTDTKYFHEYIYGRNPFILLKGRLAFGSAKNKAPFPSMIVIMRSKEKHISSFFINSLCDALGVNHLC